MEKWVLENKRGDFYGLAEALGVDPLIVRLMINRGITGEAEMRSYLFGTIDELHDQKLMKDLVRGADVIDAAIAEGTTIMIAADYDVDGIFSGELLYETITGLGGQAYVVTPNRVADGYGLNVRMVEEAAAQGTKLILTCDNGVGAFEAIERAYELGLRVVVTDHHEIVYSEEGGERIYRIPKAEAVINPHRIDCDYPFKSLCGCGVAYKLSAELYERRGLNVPPDFLEYTAIATVSDVMNLTDENRIIVREGLRRLEHTDNVGLAALIRACGIADKKLTAYHIGFIIGPCFNATGRLETTEKALELLREKNPARADELAMSLCELNSTRKKMTEDGTAAALTEIRESGIQDDKVMLVLLPECHESLVGIIAGRIREEFNRPTIVLSRTEKGLKGSGRSIDNYHMVDALSACKDILLKYGGHAMAAGLSVDEDNLPELRRRLNDLCNLNEDDFIRTVRIDAAMPLGYITEELIEQFDLLEPFGKANAKPLFAENSYSLCSARLLGKNENVLKMSVRNTAGTVMDAMLFSDVQSVIDQIIEKYGEEEWQRALSHRPNRILLDIAYYPGINEYQGNKSLQILVQNIRVR